MTSDELKALWAKLTEMTQRYNVKQISVYVTSQDRLFARALPVGAYALDEDERMVCLDGASFGSVLRALEHRLIALRMGKGASQ